MAVVKGYLLDTNHIAYLFSHRSSVINRIRDLAPGSQLRASVISLGEIEAAHGITKTTDLKRRLDFERFVHLEFRQHALVVGPKTRFYYGDLIEGIWQRNPPSNRNVRTEHHLVHLGVDVNDVWIAAQAIEHNLVLVTEDAMESIRESAGPLLDIENWAV